MAPNAPHHPRKLVGSRWTALNVEQKRQHWVVVAHHTKRDQATLRAVLDGHQMQIPWRELRDRNRWTPGWQ